jgi:serine/threonine-protein kinase
MKTCPVCDTDYPDQHHTCPTDGAMLIVSHELAAGSLVRGKYRITRKLGQGGMGVVYQAEHMMLGGRVALKFLTGDLGKDPRFIKRFRMEARAAYQLRHPNIVEVTDLDQAEDGSLFIAMEYVEGPSLRAAIDEAPAGLEIARALELGRGIASGLAEAHAHATVHRDIKPENILLATSRDGRELPKVLDFGIAAITESVTRTSVTRGLMLTPNYAAPEQWEEMPAAEMDGRTDLYALGCVVYEMLTGRTPFHAHNTSGWMKQHLEETPRPPSEFRPELADWPGVDGLAMRLLAKNRDDRPQDAELLGLLDDLLYGSGQARPEPASEQRQERPATIIEEEWRRPGAVPTPLPQRVSLYPSQHLTQPPLQHLTQPPSQHISQHLTQPPSQPPSQSPVPEPKPVTRKFPGWAWGALGLLALAAVVAAGWFFVPHPQPQQTPAAVGQPAASPAQAQSPEQSLDQHEPQPSVAEEPKSAPATQAEAKPAAKAAAEKPASPPAGKPAQTNVPTPSAQKPEPSPAPPVAPPAAQKPSGAEMEQQAASLYKAGRSSEAATLFDQACSAGSREACANLGVMYASGKGVVKDDARAAALYATACNAGDATGCNNLGNIYAFGRGVSKDNAEAASLYAKACADGNAVGCSNLGNYYRLGIGVEQDSAKARQFLTKGCGMGNQWGCDRLKEMQ